MTVESLAVTAAETFAASSPVTGVSCEAPPMPPPLPPPGPPAFSVIVARSALTSNITLAPALVPSTS